MGELRYKPWGETRYTWGSTVTDYQYTGQRNDDDISLYYYGARWYDTFLGRFTSPDSIIPEQSQGVQAWDRYAYVNNSPINYTDPTGNSYKPPCLVCDRVWWNYSSYSPIIRRALDHSVVLAVGCFLVGCHVDRVQNAINGPTTREHNESIVANAYALVTPLEFGGGAYSQLDNLLEDGTRVVKHHLVPDASSPLPKADGPSIQMLPEDHYQTASFAGRNVRGQPFRDTMDGLISQGRWRDAFAMGINDVRRIAGSQYNSAIQQALDYARLLGLLKK